MEAFFKLIRNPFLFRFFLLTRLPAAFLAGIRLELITPERAVVKIAVPVLDKKSFSIYLFCMFRNGCRNEHRSFGNGVFIQA